MWLLKIKNTNSQITKCNKSCHFVHDWERYKNITVLLFRKQIFTERYWQILFNNKRFMKLLLYYIGRADTYLLINILSDGSNISYIGRWRYLFCLWHTVSNILPVIKWKTKVTYCRNNSKSKYQHFKKRQNRYSYILTIFTCNV